MGALGSVFVSMFLATVHTVQVCAAVPDQEAEACQVIAQLGNVIQVQTAAPTKGKGKAKAGPRVLALCPQSYPELDDFEDAEDRLQAETDLLTDLVSAFREHTQVRTPLNLSASLWSTLADHGVSHSG